MRKLSFFLASALLVSNCGEQSPATDPGDRGGGTDGGGGGLPSDSGGGGWDADASSKADTEIGQPEGDTGGVDAPGDAPGDAPDGASAACDDAPPPLPPTTGKTIHVAPTGSDGSGDGSIAKPFATPAKAAAFAGPGDAIVLEDGTYQLAEPQGLALSGTASAPIVLKAAANAHPILDGSNIQKNKFTEFLAITQGKWVIIDGLEVTNAPGVGISTGDSDHVTVQRCHVHHAYGYGILAVGSNLSIIGNEVDHAVLSNQGGKSQTWDSGISTVQVEGGGNSTNVQFIGNHVHDVWGECLIANFGEDVVMRGNRVHDCFSVNVYVDHGKRVRIERNLIYATTDAYNSQWGRAIGVLLAVEDDGGLTPFADEDVVIANNIMDGTATGVSFWADPAVTSPENTYRNVKVLFNVVRDPRYRTFAFDAAKSAPTGCVLAGNIAWAPQGAAAVEIGDPGAWTFADNDFPDGVPTEASGPGTFAKDPMLVGPSIATTGASGFRLQPGSPCIASAHAVADVPVDIACAPRATPTTSMGVFGP
jgi:hypothetical protein